LRGPGEILVISCYELGRQPLALAGALAALERAGFSPAAQDVSVEPLSDEKLSAAKLVLISVPMHTALQLGVRVAARARAFGARVAFFGLYAALNAEHLLARHGEYVAGESADDLVELARAPVPRRERAPAPPGRPRSPPRRTRRAARAGARH